MPTSEREPRAHRSRKPQRSLRWGLMWCGVALLWMSALVGCPEKKCTLDEDCGAGTFCKVIDGTCIAECKEERDCLTLEKCKSNKGGCVCNTTVGRCEPKKTACTPKARKACVGDQVHWFDSCDYQGALIEDCGKSGCLDGKCKQVDRCGNGSCEPGLEDCLSCAKDCACQNDEVCETDGTCKKKDNCGNGKCDKGEESCATCPGDCPCANGEICQNDGACKSQASCGNGKCETDKQENCVSCPKDCLCGGGQFCNTKNATCENACGNGKCDVNLGENCNVCAQDCPCRKGQRCSQNRCENTCGNGKCESSYGEDCENCRSDCACPAGMKCEGGKCGSNCGNGKCETDKQENCSTCAADCGCASSKYCESGQCKDWCGNGTCDSSRQENCDTCAKDCGCPKNFACNAGTCKPLCGDGKCEASQGETCATCAKDCGCKAGSSCVQGKCECVPQCQGKTCGDDGCGGSCGTCLGRTECKSGKCECRHGCKTGESSCVGSGSYERCEQDKDGCRYKKNLNCQSGQVCQNGSCCASGCGTKNCGPDGCGGSCGSCSKRATCQSGNCVCKHECTKGASLCSGTGAYKECLTDPGGCRYWSPVKPCATGQKCAGNKCCTPICSGKECGPNGCGGSCGKCAYGCVNGLCKRVVLVVSVDIPCGVCSDPVINRKPDIYVKLSLSTGTSYKSNTKNNSCGKQTFTWSVPSLDALALKNAKLEVLDEDTFGSDDLCGRWSGDFSKIGTQSFIDKGKQNAKITITVKR